MKDGFDQHFRRILGGHHGALTVASLLVTAAAIFVVATQWNINSDFKELLPGDSEAAQAMEEVGQRVGSGSSLFVVIDSPEQEANREFASVYAEALRELPDIALAHFHNEKEFFEDHKLLYVDAEDLESIHQRIKDRIREERQRENPLFVPLDDGPEEVDTREVEDRYEELAHQDYREYLEADDGYSLTIVVRFGEASTDLDTTSRLLDSVRQIGQDLDPASYHPDMELEYGGGLVHRERQYSSIVDDVVKSALFTIIGIFLVISLYFRRFRAVALVLVPLIMAVLWTFAAAFLFFGELTTISVFVFAILLGLGIDFSIHLLNGYDRERLEGKDPVDALVNCYGSVGRATVMGGTTTFATFVVLSFAQFQGLAQFGQVSAMGVLFMVLAMVVTLPAMVLTIHQKWPHTPDKERTAEHMLSFDRWFHEGNLARFAPGLLVGSALFLGLAIWQVPNLYFEENFREIGEVENPWQRAANAEQEAWEERTYEARRDAIYAGRDVAAKALELRENVEPDSFVPDREQTTTGQKYTSALSGQHSSTPTLLLMDDVDEAGTVFRHMQNIEEEGGLETVRSLASIHAFMPGDLDAQQKRLEVIAEIKETLETEDLSSLDDDEQERLEDLRTLVEVGPISVYDMPGWAKRMFREAGPMALEPADGEEFAFEYLIYVNEAIDHMVGDEARQFLSEVQEASEGSGVDVRIGSQSYIYTAMLDEIRNDGARMLAIALVIVFLLLSFYFRSPLRAGVALIPLTIGAIWALGFAAWFGIKLDFFNVVVLPVIIGIGIDDGLHFYHRYLDRGRGSIIEVSYHVGAAVGMTTITSMIGFGGLAITDYAGLQSIGYLAITGLAGAFLATIMILPALLWYAEKFEWTALLPEHEWKGK